MRGTRAKKLRKFATRDLQDQPWVLYDTVRRSHHSPNTTTILSPDCQKSWYKVLKKVWKMF